MTLRSFQRIVHDHSRFRQVHLHFYLEENFINKIFYLERNQVVQKRTSKDLGVERAGVPTDLKMIASLFSDVLQIIESVALWLVEIVFRFDGTRDRMSHFQDVAASIDVSGQLTLKK